MYLGYLLGSICNVNVASGQNMKWIHGSSCGHGPVWTEYTIVSLMWKWPRAKMWNGYKVVLDMLPSLYMLTYTLLLILLTKTACCILPVQSWPKLMSDFTKKPLWVYVLYLTKLPVAKIVTFPVKHLYYPFSRHWSFHLTDQYTLPRYLNWHPDPNAVTINAFFIKWGTEKNFSLFSPFSIIGKEGSQKRTN